MTKEMLKIFAFILFGLLLINLVSAASFLEDMQQGVSSLVTSLSSDTTTNFLHSDGFVKTLFFILVLLIVSVILSIIPLFSNKKGIAFLIAVIISFLAVYYLPAVLIASMLDPYKALGVAFISIIPFILIFFFTQYMLTNTFLKKVAWMFFAVFLLTLTVYTSITQTQKLGSGAWISWVYALVSILALLMVFFNTWIDQHVWSGKMAAGMNAAQKRMQARIALDRLKEAEAEAQGIPTGLARS